MPVLPVLVQVVRADQGHDPQPHPRHPPPQCRRGQEVSVYIYIEQFLLVNIGGSGSEQEVVVGVENSLCVMRGL